ncbi:hypothetical protein [Streptomyces sp. NPDC089799]|uniref:hypothetical protein n=1 Tax=Streptomyces sp. NPDC089799 TaxID=3155066 RepID=UPI00343DE93D
MMVSPIERVVGSPSSAGGGLLICPAPGAPLSMCLPPPEHSVVRSTAHVIAKMDFLTGLPHWAWGSNWAE